MLPFLLKTNEDDDAKALGAALSPLMYQTTAQCAFQPPPAGFLLSDGATPPREPPPGARGCRRSMRVGQPGLRHTKLPKIGLVLGGLGSRRQAAERKSQNLGEKRIFLKIELGDPPFSPRNRLLQLILHRIGPLAEKLTVRILFSAAPKLAGLGQNGPVALCG